MASKKCHVCNCKSTTRWYSVKENVQQVENCFYVEVEKASQGEEVYLCASCRRNFTRWRQSNEHKDKYFVKANSRGKPFVNKTTLAQHNRRLGNLTETSSVSLLLCLPTDVLLDIFTCLEIVDILNLRLTCRHVNKLCSFNYLWKFLLRRDFPNASHLLDEPSLSKCSLAYRLLYSVSLSSKREALRHRSQMVELEHQFGEDTRKLVEQNVDLQQRLNGLQSKLTTLQFDRDPNTSVSKLQEQVT